MNQLEPNGDYIWIGRQAEMPNVCISCGLYTDDRVKLVHQVTFQQRVAKPKSGNVLLSVILHLLLGPVALFIELFNQPESDGEAVTETKEETKRKIKIKVPHCVLCRAVEPPNVIANNPNTDELLVKAHPRFRQRMNDI